MSTIARGLLYAVIGIPVGALLGYGVVLLLSGNTHDLSVEAAMTAVFVGGPVGAIAGFAIGLLNRK